MMGPQFIIEVMEILHGPELFDFIAEHAPVTEAFCRKAMELWGMCINQILFFRHFLQTNGQKQLRGV